MEESCRWIAGYDQLLVSDPYCAPIFRYIRFRQLRGYRKNLVPIRWLSAVAFFVLLEACAYGRLVPSPATQAGLDLKRSDTPTTVLGNVSLVSNTVI